MLGHYFGFFHGGLTDLWISPGFRKKREMGGGTRGVCGVVIVPCAAWNGFARVKPGLSGPPRADGAFRIGGAQERD
jgi:hypothetical protein